MSDSTPASGQTSPNDETVFIAKGRASGLAIDSESNRIYISYFGSGNMIVLDGNTNHILDTIKLPEVDRMIVYPELKRIYALAGAEGSSFDIFVIDTRTHEILGRIPIHRPLSLPSTSTNVFSINKIRNEIYVTKKGGYFKPGYLLIIDGSSNLETGRIEVENDPSGVACDEKADLIYVANRGSKSISIIDRKACRVSEAIDLKEPVSVAINPTLKVLYAVRQQGWGVEGAGGMTEIFHVLDLESGDTIRKIEFATDENGFDFNPRLNTLYIKDTAKNTLLKFDGMAGKRLGEVKMGKVHWFTRLERRGDFVAINNKTNKVYVTDHETGLLHVFDP